MFRKWGRSLKYRYLKVIRNRGASSIVARSFAVGLFIEFITLPTMGLAFFLLFPLIKIIRGIFAIALIAFALGKAMVPFFLILNYKLGHFLFNEKGNDMSASTGGGGLSFEMIKENPKFFLEFLSGKGLAFLVGSAINGLVVATISYFLINYGIRVFREARERRKEAKKNKEFNL